MLEKKFECLLMCIVLSPISEMLFLTFCDYVIGLFPSFEFHFGIIFSKIYCIYWFTSILDLCILTNTVYNMHHLITA